MGFFDKSLKEIGTGILGGLNSLLETSPKDAYKATVTTAKSVTEKTKHAYKEAKLKANARKLSDIASFIGVKDAEVEIERIGEDEAIILFRTKKKSEDGIEDATIISETKNA